MSIKSNVFAGLRPLSRDGAMRDAIAGLALASMNIPQLLGYTRIAGTPAVTGLYTALLPLLMFAVFGSSRHLVVAADSATAAIFSSGLSGMAAQADGKYMALVGMVALLTAALLLLARIFKLGFFADFLSRTVLVGFLTGVGLQIGIAMLGEMSGIQVSAHKTVDQLQQLAGALAAVNLPTLAVSLLVVSFILVFRHFLPKLPIPLFAVLTGIAASYAYDFAGHGIAVIGPIPGGLPTLGFPAVSWDDTLKLIPVALSCFVIIIAQSAATSRVFAVRHHERLDENADILGLSAANAAAALSGAFVVNGSPTQTAMADSVGSRSQFSQLVFAGVVLLVLLLFTKPLEYLPRSVLAGIVFVIAIGLIDFKSLADIRRESRGEFMLAIVTAATVALVGLEQGILLAVTLSLLRHVRHSYRPHTSVLTPDETGRWLPAPVAAGVETKPGLVVYRFGADLFYANEGCFCDEVRLLIDHAPTPVRWLLIDAGAMTDMDYSAARSLRELCCDLQRSNIKLVFGRVSAYLREDMNRHRITGVIGKDSIFSTLHEALDAVGGRPRVVE
ncbi:SulP family inorganic anion transporter [Candidatus Methylospira mobilis]|uniref:SulP family inorganic anion transporter n=1 Tax=Candidatus Methylospira mobilis TaxID=1808979 RepID=A0A5Q0BLP4_9GAMM|nr:SulP family inorganic anion transporter [Candidatus Methylospira mobilis]QFY44052.1 SulP family inorganic anion transporter [Candidatus Methylospira mobilis]WNV05057.1 SulP family inorganic anion transporter [Candidatus Methylospira mobilis]